MKRESKTYTTRLIGRSMIAVDTYALEFERPKGFSFLAGQHILLSLPSSAHDDSNGYSRYFSISSAPHDATLTILIRLRNSAFKQFLTGTEIGTQFSIGEAKGKLTTDNEDKNLTVCIAGGIGVAPFMSIIREAATHSSIEKEFLLLYSNRSLQTAIFLDELHALASAHPWFRFIPTMTRTVMSDLWNGEVGRINEALIRKSVPHIAHADFLIAGAHDFVIDMKAMLQQIGIPDTAIFAEEFCGYAGFCCPHCIEQYAARPSDTA